MNNTEDFPDGRYLDNTGAWGLDLLHDRFHRFIARKSLVQSEMGIVGPRTLFQCPTCGLYFIIRLPIASRTHYIDVDGEAFPRWGFATALINWDALVERSDIQKRFQSNGLEFQITRTDHIYNETSDTYTTDKVVLVSSAGFGTKPTEVSTALQTTNNEWVMTVQYDVRAETGYIVVVIASVVVSFFISYLVCIVLVQKQTHSAIQGAEKAKVELERHLTASLAHELRNPLGAIDSALACMPSDDSLPSDAKDLIKSMQLCTVFMSSIMNNLLDSRKLEEGKLTLLHNPFSLKSLLYAVHKMMKPAVNPKVQLTVDVTSLSAKKEWVYGDVHRLQQVMTNLVSNSVKFTREGSITLSVRWVRPQQQSSKTKNASNDEWVELKCRDTGPGIPKGDQADLFNRFTTRGGAPGSGLGLAIARQIVELMGGSIRFESDPTVVAGTDCIVLLPLQVCEEPQVEPKKEENASTQQDDVDDESKPLQQPLKILLTDDIKMNRTLLKRRMEKCVAPNSIITEAATGEAALKLCESERFDIIVMDQYMQQAGGVLVGTDVLIALRRANVDSIMIGCSGNDLEEKFKDAGAVLVWKKPLPPNDEIIKSLRQLLAARDQEV